MSATTDLTTDHVAIQDAVRRFSTPRSCPVAELERADRYPSDLFPKLAALGVLGMTIPAEYGGSPLDLVCYALVFEELARGWMGLASVVGSSASGAWLITRYGTPEQRERYLGELAAGRRMSGIALTEPSTGSDLKAITPTAVRDGDHYIMSGTKTMITQAAHADPLIVLAVTNPAAEPRHRGTPGCTVSGTIGKVGHKGVELCEVILHDARVPAGQLARLRRGTRAVPDIERPRSRPHLHGRGQRRDRERLPRGRRPLRIRARGVRQSDRRPPGNQVEAGADGDARARLPSAHARRRGRLDAGERGGSAAAMAKGFASESAIDCSMEAIRILGGYGFTVDFPVERYYRDAPLMAIGEGTNEILQLLIADHVLSQNGPHS